MHAQIDLNLISQEGFPQCACIDGIYSAKFY